MPIFQKIKNLYGKLSNIDNKIYNGVVRQNYHNLYLTSQEIGTTDESYPEGQLIISLTSYGNKLQLLYLTIESLLHQTIKPNKIILWLDQTAYNTYESIPIALHRQEARGLEIRLCEDIKSYTKLVPALINFPNAVIISSMTISYIQLISLSVYIVLTKKTLARFIFIEVIISCSTKTAHQDLILSG